MARIEAANSSFAYRLRLLVVSPDRQRAEPKIVMRRSSMTAGLLVSRGCVLQCACLQNVGSAGSHD
jgi:hypothetical protein